MEEEKFPNYCSISDDISKRLEKAQTSAFKKIQNVKRKKTKSLKKKVSKSKKKKKVNKSKKKIKKKRKNKDLEKELLLDDWSTPDDEPIFKHKREKKRRYKKSVATL
jgi:hypothetical protein